MGFGPPLFSVARGYLEPVYARLMLTTSSPEFHETRDILSRPKLPNMLFQRHADVALVPEFATQATDIVAPVADVVAHRGNYRPDLIDVITQVRAVAVLHLIAHCKDHRPNLVDVITQVSGVVVVHLIAHRGQFGADPV